MPKELNIEELVIPEDFMFKEAFEILKYMAIKYPDECMKPVIVILKKRVMPKIM